MNKKIALTTLAVCVGLAACGELGETDMAGETVADDPGPHEAVAQAMALFPDYATLHKEVITRTCTPNEGVCHNQKEYPDLHTPGSMLAVIGKPCNLNEEDPLQIFNGCEGVGDFAVLELGPASEPVLFEVEVGWVEFMLDEAQVVTSVRVHLRAPLPAPMPGRSPMVRFTRMTKSGTIDVGVLGEVTWVAGERFFDVANTEIDAAEFDLVETHLVVGDPNRDGEFGADDGFHMIEPGSPERSYLLQRLQGNVPGSPMPLANQALSSAEIVALACWIEGLAGPGAQDDPGLEINYETCEFAQHFASGAVSGGHSLVEDVQPILDQSCAFAGCHAGAAPSAGLDLSAGAAADSLLRASEQNPEQQLIEPGNPTNSYLITKLTGNGVAGVQMPRDGEPLDETSIGIIRQWISEGAAND